MRANCVSASVAFLVTLSALYGQDARGRVQGVVTDSTQAVVVSAKVLLTNDETGISVLRESNAAGHFIFDFVDPGRYTVSVEQPGFSKFVQQNVIVQVRGDVSVNITLKVGGVAETVTITEAPPAVQFNTSTMDQVVEHKMLEAMPVLARNPFALALLDPAVTTGYAANVLLPFNKWQTASFKVGGGAGGIMSLSMKSGTNEIHGTAHYFGRNPKLNARTHSVTNTPNLVRNHIAGSTIGGPIIKNKLFTFGSYEKWKMTEGNYALFTLPTALERTGDSSQSLNSQDGLRQILDPFSTKFDPVTGTVTRTPFADNKIP